MKKGILCHGRHLLAINWELHQFGDTQNKLLGQIAKTCLLAYEERPELIIFGTGASKLGEKIESEYTIQYMMDNFFRLKDFPQFEGIDLHNLKDFMHRNSIPEKKSQNTYQEIKYAGEVFYEKGIYSVILVSNPDHISRCGQLVHQVYQESRLESLKRVFLCQSEVGYNGTNIITSRIIESPHRGDDESPDLSIYIGDYFKLSLQGKKEFFQAVESLIKRLK